MKKSNGIANSIANVIAFDIISKVLSVGITILLIRNLSTTEYATFTIFNSIATLFYGIVGSGLSLAFVRFYVEHKTRGNGKNKGLFFSNIILVVVIYFVLFLTIPLTKRLFNVNSLVMGMALLYGFALSVSQLNEAYYQARELYSKSGLISNLKFIILILYLIFIFSLLKNDSINVVLMGYIFSSASAFLFGVFLIYKNGERLLKIEWSNFIAMIDESIWLMIYMLILNMFTQMDIFMINYFLDSVSVSNYGVAYKYYGLALTLLSAIQIVLRVKTASKDIIDDVDRQRNFTISWIKKIAPISAVVTIVAIVFSWYIFPIINGPQYNDSIPAFNILMIGVGISYITAPNMGVMRATGKHKLLVLIALGAFCINLIGNYLFIPKYGINAAAMATIVSQFFLNGSCTLIILLRKKKLHGSGF